MPDRYLAASLFFVSAVVLFIAGVLFGVDAVYRDCCQKELKRAGLAMNVIATAFLMAATLANWNYNGPMATKWTKEQRIRCCSKLLLALFTIGSSITITVLSGYLLKEDACNWSGFKLTNGLAPVALSLFAAIVVLLQELAGPNPAGKIAATLRAAADPFAAAQRAQLAAATLRAAADQFAAAQRAQLAAAAGAPAAGTAWCCWPAAQQQPQAQLGPAGQQQAVPAGHSDLPAGAPAPTGAPAGAADDPAGGPATHSAPLNIAENPPSERWKTVSTQEEIELTAYGQQGKLTVYGQSI